MEPLSSAAIAISSIITTKAFEKSGEKLGEFFTEQLGKFINLVKTKALPKTQAIQEQSNSPDFDAAVQELETAIQSDSELRTAVLKLSQVIESDPKLLEKVRNTALLVKEQPYLIQNQTKLAEKIGLVVQGGTVAIDNLSF